MIYEVTHDGDKGDPVSKTFRDLEDARAYAQGKVFAGGPARFRVIEQDTPEKAETPPKAKSTRRDYEPPPKPRRTKAPMKQKTHPRAKS